MGNIQLTARFLIHEGKEEEFKSIAAQCLNIVKEKEKDTTLQYDWFFNTKGNECVVRETYLDSNAIFLHLGNLGDLLGQFLQIADFYPEIYGSPSKEILNAIKDMNPKTYSFYQGL
jgi:quinol monooxygenase YgiN